MPPAPLPADTQSHDLDTQDLEPLHQPDSQHDAPAVSADVPLHESSSALPEAKLSKGKEVETSSVKDDAKESVAKEETGTSPVETRAKTPSVVTEAETPSVENKTGPSPAEASVKPPPLEIEVETPPLENETEPSPVKASVEPPPLRIEVETPPLKNETEPSPIKAGVQAPPLETEAKTPPLEGKIEPSPVETKVKASSVEGDVQSSSITKETESPSLPRLEPSTPLSESETGSPLKEKAPSLLKQELPHTPTPQLLKAGPSTQRLSLPLEIEPASLDEPQTPTSIKGKGLLTSEDAAPKGSPGSLRFKTRHVREASASSSDGSGALLAPPPAHLRLNRQQTHESMLDRAPELSVMPATTRPISSTRLDNLDPDRNLEAALPLDRTNRPDRTQTRLAALTAPVREAYGAVREKSLIVMKNEFSSGDWLKGWGSSIANTLTKELLVGTNPTTMARELVSMGAEAIVEAKHLTPEQQAFGVFGIFMFAAGANVLAMVHKSYKGTSIPNTQRGHMLQIATLLGTMTLAGLVGRGGKNGQFGVLSTLLPSAIKSVAYMSRDLLNLLVPLNGNRDDQYTKPVQGQATDGSYFLTEEAVNAGQDAIGMSGVSVLDALMSHSMSPGRSIGRLFGYSLLNTAGEAIANVSLRAANEVAIGGWRSRETLQNMKDLRLQYGKYSSENGSFGAQFVDKMAGPGLARLSLFLSLYAVGSVIAHAFSGTRLAAGVQNHLEEATGAALIVVGCLEFAMSTSGKAPTPTVNLSTPSTEDVRLSTTGVVSDDAVLASNEPSTSGRRPVSVLTQNSTSGRPRSPSIEVA
ncbi:hypothetical protein [Paraburkholderia sp.]|uniref:hypothetical protein n=1 Tax=Paraburkholderia sp. TaxID=1926495 RepID=UPI003D6EEC7A